MDIYLTINNMHVSTKISRKFRLPVRHYVFYFGDKPSKMIHKLPSQALFDGFSVLDFKTLDYRDLLLSETGSEVILAILADFKEHAPEAVIRLILKRLRAVSKDEAELKKYFSQLNVLSRLRNLSEETVKNIEAMPIIIDIEKDYLYQKGLEKGLEEGLEKGLEEGREEGFTEGDRTGQAKKTHDAAVNMLKKGYEVAAICEVLEVSEAYVRKIKKELKLQ